MSLINILLDVPAVFTMQSPLACLPYPCRLCPYYLRLEDPFSFRLKRETLNYFASLGGMLVNTFG